MKWIVNLNEIIWEVLIREYFLKYGQRSGNHQRSCTFPGLTSVGIATIFISKGIRGRSVKKWKDSSFAFLMEWPVESVIGDPSLLPKGSWPGKKPGESHPNTAFLPPPISGWGSRVSTPTRRLMIREHVDAAPKIVNLQAHKGVWRRNKNDFVVKNKGQPTYIFFFWNFYPYTFLLPTHFIFLYLCTMNMCAVLWIMTSA